MPKYWLKYATCCSAATSAYFVRCALSGVAQMRIGMPSASPFEHRQSPTAIATRYVDILGVVEKRSVCFPAAGPGVSEAILPLEMAVSPSSTTRVMAKVALSAGSSNDGNARRASVGSICVVA